MCKVRCHLELEQGLFRPHPEASLKKKIRIKEKSGLDCKAEEVSTVSQRVSKRQIQASSSRIPRSTATASVTISAQPLFSPWQHDMWGPASC